MDSSVQAVLRRLEADGIERVELKVSDLMGHWHAIGLDAQRLSERAFQQGIPIDAGGIEGWPDLLPRELTVLPDPATAWIDPFLTPRTISLIGAFQVQTPGRGAWTCPRSLCARALAHLAGSGLADAALFGAAPGFFLFDGPASGTGSGSDCRVGPGDAPGRAFQEELPLTLAALGVRAQGREPCPPGSLQSLRLDCGDPLRAADALMVTRYVVRRVAHRHRLSATFLPRPTPDRVRAGMAVHQSLWKGGHPLFYGEGTYAGLSQTARWYVGGLLRHAASLAAITLPGTNSYRRPKGGAGGPTRLTYAKNDPAAVIRVPASGGDPAGSRVVLRQSDGLANPYLAFSAMLLAGLDGMRHRIDPGPPGDRESEPPAEASGSVPASLPGDLRGALEALAHDRDYLLAGGVFPADLLEDWIALKRRELEELEEHPHPHEFSFYPQA